MVGALGAGIKQMPAMNDGRNDNAHDDADGNANQRRQCEMRVRAHRRIGAAPEEYDVTDGDLAGIAANDVPG